MRFHQTLIALSLIAVLSACTAGQHNHRPNQQRPPVARGEVVPELGSAIWSVFHATNGDYWFGSPDRGVYRYDGKTLVNFTTKDGLPYNHASGMHEDKAGNIYFTTSSEFDTVRRRFTQAISRFDGKAFTTLAVPENAPSETAWKLEPDDLWFGGGQDTGSLYRYDGKTFHRLAFPKTKAGEDHNAAHPRSKYPNIKYSPYDTYCMFKDSKGHLWFGTAILGACRYDGKSFSWVPEAVVRNGSFGTRSIIEDKDGRFWFSNTRHRYGVSQNNAAAPEQSVSGFRKEIGLVSPHDQEEIFFQGSVLDHTGALWMATYGDGVWRNDGDKLTHYPIKDGGKTITLVSIYKDRQGVLWLSTHAAGVYKYNGKTFAKWKP